MADAPCCAVEDLHGPHELELLEAAAACWIKDKKIVQVICLFTFSAATLVVGDFMLH